MGAAGGRALACGEGALEVVLLVLERLDACGDECRLDAGLDGAYLYG